MNQIDTLKDIVGTAGSDGYKLFGIVAGIYFGKMTAAEFIASGAEAVEPAELSMLFASQAESKISGKLSTLVEQITYSYNIASTVARKVWVATVVQSANPFDSIINGNCGCAVMGLAGLGDLNPDEALVLKENPESSAAIIKALHAIANGL